MIIALITQMTYNRQTQCVTCAISSSGLCHRDSQRNRDKSIYQQKLPKLAAQTWDGKESFLWQKTVDYYLAYSVQTLQSQSSEILSSTHQGVSSGGGSIQTWNSFSPTSQYGRRLLHAPTGLSNASTVERVATRRRYEVTFSTVTPLFCLTSVS